MEQDDICCGAHEICEKGLMKPPKTTEIEYFDDEELDIYKGKKSDEYSENEIEEFREILYTMYTYEINDWLRSLHQREIELPEELKDEVILLMEGKG